MRKSKTSLIFQAAIDVFSEKGFDKATMDDIAARANVAKGTIYYHFKSKEELFLFLVEEGVEMLRDGVESKLLDDMHPREKIELILREQISFFGQYRDFCVILLRESWGAEDRQLEFRKMIRSYMSLIEGVVREGIEADTFHSVNAENAGSALFGMAAIASLHILLGKGEYDEEQLFSDLKRMALAGLVK
ncbi:TetR/AcrR family transcriptional regulator [Tumebacillus sp. ITR2]|uniref:TetR/AcrR family transcriptional regulator n=1 Tax=Tumebacillus amylolyticus TaxID=2801339 RepID=A0ABS1J7F7_9BACL|nr:TetR/AcrR family transcriptional regulator [Tumebacillus amylolyticus]MBL0386189.1 TetR/AcrR family transcriptional regulator [Tumebacillus amylolyticus]